MPALYPAIMIIFIDPWSYIVRSNKLVVLILLIEGGREGREEIAHRVVERRWRGPLHFFFHCVCYAKLRTGGLYSILCKRMTT